MDPPPALVGAVSTIFYPTTAWHHSELPIVPVGGSCSIMIFIFWKKYLNVPLD